MLGVLRVVAGRWATCTVGVVQVLWVAVWVRVLGVRVCVVRTTDVTHAHRPVATAWVSWIPGSHLSLDHVCRVRVRRWGAWCVVHTHMMLHSATDASLNRVCCSVMAVVQ